MGPLCATCHLHGSLLWRRDRDAIQDGNTPTERMPILTWLLSTRFLCPLDGRPYPDQPPRCTDASQGRNGCGFDTAVGQSLTRLKRYKTHRLSRFSYWNRSIYCERAALAAKIELNRSLCYFVDPRAICEPFQVPKPMDRRTE